MEIRDSFYKKSGFQKLSFLKRRRQVDRQLKIKDVDECNDFGQKTHKLLSRTEKDYKLIDFHVRPSELINIVLNDATIAKLPQRFAELAEVINKSKYLLKFEENWDEEGSKAYLVDTWISASKFLVKYAGWIYDKYGKLIATPSIMHAPNGSIDIYWETDRYNLLLNIPEQGLATYYGDYYSNDGVENTLDVKRNNFDLFPILT